MRRRGRRCASCFRAAIAKGDWLGGDDTAAEANSGYIVLGMGKHGARELNYSSDIDLIVFYEPDLVRLRLGVEPLAFFVRMTRDLVRLMQERTGDGYVFRTDLRLRPDPGATPGRDLDRRGAQLLRELRPELGARRDDQGARRWPATSRPAGRFIAELAPFVWRKYLDFAAIADIHAMKRQIHAFKGFGDDRGRRPQHQGRPRRHPRDRVLRADAAADRRRPPARPARSRETLGALDQLVARGWIKPEVRDDLADSLPLPAHGSSTACR